MLERGQSVTIVDAPPHARHVVGRVGVVLAQEGALNDPKDAYMVRVPCVGIFAPFTQAQLEPVQKEGESS